MRRKQSYSREFCGLAVEEVVNKQRPIVEVARELGVLPGTLGNWVSAYRKEHEPDMEDEPLSLTDRAELAELRRENQQLRTKNEFLGKAAAFFAKDYR